MRLAAFVALLFLLGADAVIQLTEPDGTVRTFREVIPASPVTPAPATQPATQPAPVITPVPTPVITPVITKTVNIRPGSIEADWKQVTLASNVLVLFEDGTHVLPHSLNILGDDVVVRAKSGRPKLVANGSIITHFGIGKSSDRAVIEGLELSSDDAYGSWPFGVMVSGNEARVRDVIANKVHYFFDLTDNARNFTAENCRNTVPGSIAYYFCYAKGSNISLIGCVAQRPLSGFLRSNNCVGLNIIDCESFGGTSTGGVSDRTGRVLLQYVSNVNIRNLKIHRSFFGTGPLWNIDGWNQRSSDAEFFARRTANVRAEGLAIDGGGKLEIGYGSKDVRINTVGAVDVKYPAPASGLPADVLPRLAKPQDIWINGAKTR